MSGSFKWKRYLVTIQDIISYIQNGEEYNNLISVESADEMKYLSSIILNPIYQRNYRSSRAEESSIIESILCDIPIPEVFLVRTSGSGAQVRNVMDGKHRLNAIFRFFNNEYSLSKVTRLTPEYDNVDFKNLKMDDKIKILTSSISILEFYDIEDKDFEIELFRRYNSRNKKLTEQELLSAALYSETLKFVNNTLEKKMNNVQLEKIYNITDDRLLKQKIHQELFVILGILEKGIEGNVNKSPDITKEYMTIKSKLYKNNEDEEVSLIKERLDDFNRFIMTIHSRIEFPFSSEIIGNESRNYKFQIGIAIILATIHHYFNIDFDKKDQVIAEVEILFNGSHIMDETYNGSSTNLSSLKRSWSKYFKDSTILESFEALSLKDIDNFMSVIGVAVY